MSGDEGRGRRIGYSAIGAAIAMVLGAGGMLTASASVSSGDRTVYVPIPPCRLFDTRPGADNVGTRATPLLPGDTLTLPVRGPNGNCVLPADAVGLGMNVAITNPSADSFLTVFPADVARPLAASLNWVGGQKPVSNAVTSAISADGRISFYNLAGRVDLSVDVIGYYVAHDHDDRYYTKAEADARYVAAGAPTTQTLVLGGAAAASPLAAIPTAGGCFALPDNTAGKLWVGLPLPSGATISAVQVKVADFSASGLLSVSLWKDTFSTGVDTSVKFGATSASTQGYTVLALSGLTGAAPVGETSTYHIELVSNSVYTGSLAFCGATVTYTV